MRLFDWARERQSWDERYRTLQVGIGAVIAITLLPTGVIFLLQGRDAVLGVGWLAVGVLSAAGTTARLLRWPPRWYPPARRGPS